MGTVDDRPAVIDTLDLDDDGALLLDGRRVSPMDVERRLTKRLAVLPWVTDILVYVHGWQTEPDQAAKAGQRLLNDLTSGIAANYPGLSAFAPHLICVRWPSRSGYGPAEFRKIRDRAHAMTTTGHASHVLGALLGYLDAGRRTPAAPKVLQTASGQYLHCVGHSFGCRMLGEAILWAADPPRPKTYKWPWPSDHPFTVDTFLALQMAAPPDIFATRFAALGDGSAPITGPVVLTFSSHDGALATLHRFPEGRPGIGAVGADGAATVKLRRTGSPYTPTEFAKLTNVDASWRFTGGWPVVGAHSRVWHPETTHLLLSLASLAR